MLLIAAAALIAYLATGMALIELYERALDLCLCERYGLPPGRRPNRAIRTAAGLLCRWPGGLDTHLTEPTKAS
jgi:hypothetical protein